LHSWARGGKKRICGSSTALRRDIAGLVTAKFGFRRHGIRFAFNLRAYLAEVNDMKLALVLLSLWLVGSVPIGIVVGTVLKRLDRGYIDRADLTS